MQYGNFYFYGIRGGDIDKFEEIARCGYVLPRCRQKNPVGDSLNFFNGNEWISLCSNILIDPYSPMRKSYPRLIQKNLCLIFDDSVEGITYCSAGDTFSFERKHADDSSEVRYSDCIDEVQTKVDIPLSKLIAVGYPYKKDSPECDENIKRIRRILDENGLTAIPIVDSSEYGFSDNMDTIMKHKIGSR